MNNSRSADEEAEHDGCEGTSRETKNQNRERGTESQGEENSVRDSFLRNLIVLYFKDHNTCFF